MAAPKKKLTPQGRAQQAGKKAAAKRRAEAEAAELAKMSPAMRAARGKVNKLTKAQKATRARKRTSKAQLEALEVAREAAQKKRDRERKIQITLKTFHIINGTRYGPGTGWVPTGLVPALLEQDRRAAEAEASLYVTNSHIVTQRRGAVQVATPNFDQLWQGANSPIFDRF